MQSTQEALRKEVEKSIVARERRKLKQKAVAGQVDLNIDPSAIPMASLDAQAFYQDLVTAFHCKFDDSEIMEMIPPELRQQVNPVALLALAIRNDKMVQFLGGLLKLDAISRSSQISNMGVGTQQVSAVVHGGSTDEAMLLCKTLCLSTWRASGVDKRWEDIEPSVALARYKTTTLVDLPFSLNRLLAADLNTFLGEKVAGDTGYGKLMGYRDVDLKLHADRFNEAKVVITCREIELTVSVFNMITGRSEDNTITFLIESRTNANRGPTFISTELPINEHVDLVEKLVDSIVPGSAKG